MIFLKKFFRTFSPFRRTFSRLAGAKVIIVFSNFQIFFHFFLIFFHEKIHGAYLEIVIASKYFQQSGEILCASSILLKSIFALTARDSRIPLVQRVEIGK